MLNKDGTYPHDVGSIEPIPINERTPILDVLPSQIKSAVQGIGGLLNDPLMAMPGGFARMPLKKLMQELAKRETLYKKHGDTFQRAYKVQQSARRDGYLPDIDGSQKIMNNANHMGKKIKSEMDELTQLIKNHGNS